MVLWWRKRNKNPQQGNKVIQDLVTPNHLRCPISLELMKDPVTLSTGMTYDRECIERWFDEGNCTCPVTNQILTNLDLIPNHTLRVMIQHWCVQNQHHGVQRIPTPRVPITPIQVQHLLLNIKASATRLHQYECLQLVRKIQRWGSESERNKRCMVENGTPHALAFAFHAFAADSIETNVSVLDHILLVLNSMFPHELEATKHLGSFASLRCMVWFLKHQDLSRKERSIVALRKLLSFGDRLHVEALAQIKGINQVLVELLNQRILSPTITKASLALVWCLVSPSSPCSEKMKLKFVELGLVSLVLEILVDSERSQCEKALAVFDSLCSCEQGREKAYANALTIPLLVKKLLRVSALGTDYSVSAIWKLCKFEERDQEMVLLQALQVGAFQKLLLVLQVGSAQNTKDKTTQLLKLLHPYRPAIQCIDSDFKNLNTSV